mmetsp:Transcript_3268/g.8027  ORF Transcript_3268/g.8027 Transcript_3268/m.8027 type:complete len:224 (+) Transcript_3268:1149-1820(+)
MTAFVRGGAVSSCRASCANDAPWCLHCASSDRCAGPPSFRGGWNGWRTQPRWSRWRWPSAGCLRSRAAGLSRGGGPPGSVGRWVRCRNRIRWSSLRRTPRQSHSATQTRPRSMAPASWSTGSPMACGPRQWRFPRRCSCRYASPNEGRTPTLCGSWRQCDIAPPWERCGGPWSPVGSPCGSGSRLPDTPTTRSTTRFTTPRPRCRSPPGRTGKSTTQSLSRGT